MTAYLVRYPARLENEKLNRRSFPSLFPIAHRKNAPSRIGMKYWNSAIARKSKKPVTAWGSDCLMSWSISKSPIPVHIGMCYDHLGHKRNQSLHPAGPPLAKYLIGLFD